MAKLRRIEYKMFGLQFLSQRVIPLSHRNILSSEKSRIEKNPFAYQVKSVPTYPVRQIVAGMDAGNLYFKHK